MARILCSTGAFIGRVNNRAWRLILDYGDKIRCDGFEFMVFPGWYSEMAAIVREAAASGLPFPSSNRKSIGVMISFSPRRNFKVRGHLKTKS
jgi:hypothetical protein